MSFHDFCQRKRQNIERMMEHHDAVNKYKFVQRDIAVVHPFDSTFEYGGVLKFAEK